MKRITFTSESTERCQLIFGKNMIEKLPESIRVVDSGFKKSFAGNLKPEYLMPGGEHIKSIDRVFEIYQLVRVSRCKAVTAIGGGSIIDLVGYACAGHTEVEKLFLFPTTTVGQIMPAINGFKLNFEFVKDLLCANGIPDRVFIDSSISYKEYLDSSRSDLLFPLLVALSFDMRLFRYISNLVASGKEITEEQWDDIVFSSVKAYLKGIELKKPFVGAETGGLIETASRLRTGNRAAVILGAMVELRLAREFSNNDVKSSEVFFGLVRQLWNRNWPSRIDLSSLVDLIEQKGGLKISTPDGSLDGTYFVGYSSFERFIREKTWRGLESFA
ncbi:3-dehydroquinate synthase [Mesotoga sp. H07pep.5.4]|uniref:3-dehydroquinate synthase n=1 Tax=Mesotoga sp. H07pep.5.4 TaxID=1463664 RepID=UPI000EF1656F|nr:3-dehydroquinate synthase [Mesotoga sp. H07pep.5.4]RLL88389.1 3-dehydroquinate synthase [Mesotoga sp. H07pep.5.4]